MKQILVSFDSLHNEFKRVLIQNGFTESKAENCARIFAENTLDGVNSHGINRFPRFIEYIRKGFINVDASPVLTHSAGTLEQYDGQLGPGPLNALYCSDRAMKLAVEHGMGCVAISNTNHWMRGGTYGWHTARKGYAFIGWTNTEANMPAWGAKNRKLGNNPLVLAVPYGTEAIVLDFALSQFSYGKMESCQLNDQLLPFPGGFNNEGILTNNPAEILSTRRALPVGYWKGAGLSLLLDILAAILSGGASTSQLSKQEAEYGLSQVFIAFCLEKLNNFPSIEKTISEIINDLKVSVPDETKVEVRYPGERVIIEREHNLKYGIPVNREVWEKINIL